MGSSITTVPPVFTPPTSGCSVFQKCLNLHLQPQKKKGGLGVVWEVGHILIRLGKEGMWQALDFELAGVSGAGSHALIQRDVEKNVISAHNTQSSNTCSKRYLSMSFPDPSPL